MNDITEYDQALYYTFACDWEKLIALMSETNDDFFAKRIEIFLHAVQYEQDLEIVYNKLQNLYQHIEHAQNQMEQQSVIFY